MSEKIIYSFFMVVMMFLNVVLAIIALVKEKIEVGDYIIITILFIGFSTIILLLSGKDD